MKPETEDRHFRNRSLKRAEKVIEIKIDLEGKYVPDANYELSGKALREALAYAYRLGALQGIRKGL